MSVFLGYLHYVIFGSIAIFLSAGAIYIGLRLYGVDLKDSLTPDEWRILFKLAAIPFFLLVLYLADMSIKYPAEMFIYGRF